MAIQFFVTIEGERQGRLEGDSALAGHEGKHTGYTYDYSVDVPRPTADGRSAGRPQRSPVSFVMGWSKSSPQLLQALLTNETLNVKFEFLRPDRRRGDLTHFYTVTLENARIAHLRHVVDANSSASDMPAEYEEIGLTFERMTVESVADGITVVDDVRAGV